jgi:carbamoyl-phosphate synthase large subunit
MARRGSRPTENLNILFTCIGRRVSLLKCFRAAAKQIRINAAFMGTDVSRLSPALQLCDKAFIVKPTQHRDYIKDILKIVSENRIDLLVPTVDLDLKLLAQNKQKFANLGCYVLISSPEVVEICQDKRKTFRFLRENGFDTPLTMSVQTAMAAKNLKFPCFLKPWDGYAGRGNAVVNNRRDLKLYSKKVPNCIVQEFIAGTEYTCDVFVDFELKARCVVPRKRIEVRGGEVSKGQVVKNPRIMKRAASVVELLGAGPGVITLQLFLDKKRKIKFIELNPRFGGGVPLSIKAAANFPKWILQQLLGRRTNIRFDGFTDGLIMLRYDGEVWLQKTT